MRYLNLQNIWCYLLICSTVTLNAQTGSWTNFNSVTDTAHDDPIMDIAFDSLGVMWAASDRHIISYDGSEWTKYSYTDLGLEFDLSCAPYDLYGNLLIDHENTPWFTHHYISKFTGTSMFPYDSVSELLPLGPRKPIFLAQDKKHNIWASTNDGVIKYDPTQIPGSRFSQFTRSQGDFPHKSARLIKVDREDNIWVALRDSAERHDVLFKFDQTNWTEVSTPINSFSTIYDLAFTLDNRPIFTTWDESYEQDSLGNWVRYDTINYPDLPLGASRLTAITIDESTGDYWFGGVGRLYRLRGKRWTTFPNKGPVSAGVAITNVVFHDDEIWVTYRIDGRGCGAAGMSVVRDWDANLEVWPGDANVDHVTDVRDVLPIGLGYNESGPARTAATINWEAQPATNWSKEFEPGWDYKHADCNGDGTINALDLNAIQQNYGLTYFKGGPHKTEGPNDPLLYLEVAADSLKAGSEVSVSIKLGSDTLEAAIYGLSFSVNYTATLIDSGSVKIDYSNSWLGDTTEIIHLDQDFPNDGRIDIGISRIDHQTVTGHGEIVTMVFILEDDIANKEEITKKLKLSFDNILLVNNEGASLPVNIASLEITVWDNEIGIKPSDKQNSIRIYPNPTTNHFVINADRTEVRDISGKLVLTTTNKMVDLAGKPKGLYFIKAFKSDYVYYSKVVLK